jgi:uroporphyrinogen-III synthase
VKSVLVIRERDAFSRILEEHGFAVVNCPAIKTVRLFESVEIDPTFDGVFITSRRAAEIFATVGDFGGKVYALGAGSFEILNGSPFDLVFDPQANTAREMLASIPPEDLHGRKFLFLRGSESLRTIPEYLGEIAAVDEIIVYRTERLRIEPVQIAGEFDWICFFSPSAAESFIAQFGAERVRKSRLAVIGTTTADYFRRQGIAADLVASRPNSESFAAELIKLTGEVF